MALLTLPFQLSDAGDIVVRVELAGHGPFRFLLDTGSSRSAVSSNVAARLGLQATCRTTVITPAGRTMRPLVRLSDLRLGDLPPTDVVVTVLSADDLRGAGGVDGIIGQDILASRVYTLDYDRRLISWHSEPFTASAENAAGTRLALTINEGRMLVSLPQPGDGSLSLDLIPDTGSDGLVLFARAGRALPPLTPLGVAAVRTLAGHQLVRRVVLDQFRVGDIQLKDHSAVVVPGAGINTPVGDGLLPLHIFSRVTINGPGRYILIEQ